MIRSTSISLHRSRPETRRSSRPDSAAQWRPSSPHNGRPSSPHNEGSQPPIAIADRRHQGTLRRNHLGGRGPTLLCARRASAQCAPPTMWRAVASICMPARLTPRAAAPCPDPRSDGRGSFPQQRDCGGRGRCCVSALFAPEENADLERSGRGRVAAHSRLGAESADESETQYEKYEGNEVEGAAGWARDGWL